MFNVLADRHINDLQDALNPDATCITYDPVTGPGPDQLCKADALLVRTVTRVDSQLLDQAPQLKFVGTASVGTDHINLGELKSRGIQFASSPGCNAHSVAEYVATAILLWCEKRKKSPQKLSAGIVGVGNAGSEVKALLSRIGIRTYGYDPPRQKRTPEFTSAGLMDILSCDILSLHLPLNPSGEDATHHWLDDNKINTSSAQLFINSARGGIAHEPGLLEALKSRGSDFILDVWNNEPVFDDDIASTAFLATPHIAGYSKKSKLKATQIVCNALNEYLSLSKPGVDRKGIPNKIINLKHANSLESVLTQIHPIKRYDQQLRLLFGLPPDEKAIQFGRLRNDTPLRDEFTNIRLPQDIIKQFPILKKLGIRS
ncbi:MAG: NAD(P)-dependent oxidoreductase [Balneolales bacterium]